MKYLKYLCLLLVLFLTGCKVELYRNLPQDEANQMVALLMLNHIDVNSEIDGKTGKVTLQIEKISSSMRWKYLGKMVIPKRNMSVLRIFFQQVN